MHRREVVSAPSAKLEEPGAAASASESLIELKKMMEGEERKDGERRGSMATARRGSAVVRHLSARRSGSSSGFAISSGGGAAAELEGRMEGLNRQLAARDWVVEEDDAGRSVLVPASFSVKATPQERDERKRAVLKLYV